MVGLVVGWDKDVVAGNEELDEGAPGSVPGMSGLAGAIVLVMLYVSPS